MEKEKWSYNGNNDLLDLLPIRSYNHQRNKPCKPWGDHKVFITQMRQLTGKCGAIILVFLLPEWVSNLQEEMWNNSLCIRVALIFVYWEEGERGGRGIERQREGGRVLYILSVTEWLQSHRIGRGGSLRQGKGKKKPAITAVMSFKEHNGLCWAVQYTCMGSWKPHLNRCRSTHHGDITLSQIP